MKEVKKGAELMIFVPLNGKTVAIACATNHTLEINTETQETTSKDTGGEWQQVEAGVKSWTATTENLYCSDETYPGAKYQDLLKLQLDGTPVEVVFGGHSGTAKEVPADGWTPAATGCLKGTAIITKISVNAQNGENATFSADFTGAGPLKPMDEIA